MNSLCSSFWFRSAPAPWTRPEPALDEVFCEPVQKELNSAQNFDMEFAQEQESTAKEPKTYVLRAL